MHIVAEMYSNPAGDQANRFVIAIHNIICALMDISRIVVRVVNLEKMEDMGSIKKGDPFARGLSFYYARVYD